MTAKSRMMPWRTTGEENCARHKCIFGKNQSNDQLTKVKRAWVLVATCFCIYYLLCAYLAAHVEDPQDAAELETLHEPGGKGKKIRMITRFTVNMNRGKSNSQSSLGEDGAACARKGQGAGDCEVDDVVEHGGDGGHVDHGLKLQEIPPAV